MTTEVTVEECTAVFGRMLNEHGVTIMKTTGQKLIELGEARGRASGEMSGQRRLLQQQLLRRFGSISTRFANALATATAEQLDAFGLRLLDAKTIEDVFAA
jgi:SAM-dependent MidA family methyltransferase